MDGVLNDNLRSQMRKGLLEYCILTILSRGDSYASAIISELKSANLIVVEGTIYPLLTRQKNQGLLAVRPEISPSGPPRKYYSLTEKGRKLLSEMDLAWDDIIATVARLKCPESVPDAHPVSVRQ